MTSHKIDDAIFQRFGVAFDCSQISESEKSTLESIVGRAVCRSFQSKKVEES